MNAEPLAARVRSARLLATLLVPAIALGVAAAVIGGCGGGGGGGAAASRMVVLAWNDLGMHCMNEDFSEIAILPPYNTLCAQVIDRSGDEPEIITSGVTLGYSVPGNTHSSDKTNFWTYAQALLGASPAPDVGLTGNGMSGTLARAGTENYWHATGIPITPRMDNGQLNAYPLATVSVLQAGALAATTQAVVPVSWEIRCDLCHTTQGKTVATDIIDKHLAKYPAAAPLTRPVLCGGCHAEVNLGSTGNPGVPSLSSSMHAAHAGRMAAAGLSEPCYACHPGISTLCMRDVHYSKGMACEDCHGDMAAVGSPARRPWVDLPRCGDPACHSKSGSDYEQAGTRFRDSVGHSGIRCPACHGSPHAVTPTVQPNDNVQAIALQGEAGPIRKCTVCHRQRPDDEFFHRVTED